jgi:hypothetical protein
MKHLNTREINMKLEQEEINAIAYVLDEKIGDLFHDACWSVIYERAENYDFEVSDEDVMKIKDKLAKMMKYE